METIFRLKIKQSLKMSLLEALMDHLKMRCRTVSFELKKASIAIIERLELPSELIAGSEVRV